MKTLQELLSQKEWTTQELGLLMFYSLHNDFMSIKKGGKQKKLFSQSFFDNARRKTIWKHEERKPEWEFYLSLHKFILFEEDQYNKDYYDFTDDCINVSRIFDEILKCEKMLEILKSEESANQEAIEFFSDNFLVLSNLLRDWKPRIKIIDDDEDSPLPDFLYHMQKATPDSQRVKAACRNIVYYIGRTLVKNGLLKHIFSALGFGEFPYFYDDVEKLKKFLIHPNELADKTVEGRLKNEKRRFSKLYKHIDIDSLKKLNEETQTFDGLDKEKLLSYTDESLIDLLGEQTGKLMDAWEKYEKQ